MMEPNDLRPIVEAIVSYVDEGILVADRQGNVSYQNPAAGTILGLKASQPLQRLDEIAGIDLAGELEQALGQAGGPKPGTAGAQQFACFSLQAEIGGQLRDLEFHSCVPASGKDELRLIMIRDQTDSRRLEAVLDRSSADLVTSDPDLLQVLNRVHQVAPQNAAILLQGESGTGKTHIARMIHRLSRRRDHKFVEVNCAAIPENLLESELFGHVKGAFTGAVQTRKGRFASAHQGTLFLDEVGEIPLHLQAKLLRAVQDQEFEAVGSDVARKVDVRILSSSNRVLRTMVDEGRFRADLYYRLAVIPLYVPALRERPTDIPNLLKYFCSNLESRGYFHDVDCTPEAMRMLVDYPWPGNVRELQNAVEHAIICAVDKKVLPESLPQDIQNYCSRRAQTAAGGNEQERTGIARALDQAGGNRTRAAALLGIDRTTLWRRMRKLNL